MQRGENFRHIAQAIFQSAIGRFDILIASEVFRCKGEVRVIPS